jgi:PLP dependent protein
MTIPPMGSDPRPHFRVLREQRDELRARFPEVQHLSMGMSGDFDVAVEEGATIVRVGEAIFGPRDPRPG